MALNTLASAGFLMVVLTARGVPSGFRKYAAISGSRLILATVVVPEIAAAMRGGMAKPSVASLMAGENSSFHGCLPCSLWASSSTRSVPGVPIERPLRTALGAGAVVSVADFHWI
ncbi:hypothetical protein D3C81_1111600 [compost metagenome]